jgi:hypothetical protein
MFRSAYFADVSLNQWMALTTPKLIQAHLNLDQQNDGSATQGQAHHRSLSVRLRRACRAVMKLPSEVVRTHGKPAICLALIAGYVDACGRRAFGTYVSFMSGNTTQAGAMLGEGNPFAALPAALAIVFFVAGSFRGPGSPVRACVSRVASCSELSGRSWRPLRVLCKVALRTQRSAS